MAAGQKTGQLLELRRLEKRYGDHKAVADLSLRVEPGEFVTLLGESGSGKTTTLNMIAGFLRPTEGEILMGEVPITSIPAHRRNIGMVFQHYALFPHMTAFDNVAFPLNQRKLARRDIRVRVDEALRLVGLADHGRHYPDQLSGGQQQRVALARAIVYRPPVLLMDEPLGALDRNLREFLQREIRRLQQELGITVVYVTHDQDEALTMSDRIGIMRNGRLEQLGTGQELYEEPNSLFVARFLGASNCFDGRIERVAGQPTVVCGEFRFAVNGAKPKEEGKPGTLLIRPERLQLGDPAGGPSTSEENAINGRVRQVSYLGAVRKVDIQIGVDQGLVVQEQAGAESRFRVGDDVMVTWRAADTVFFPADRDSV
jgi:putative spermidine/putrescine transport system ATP-binding protein